MTILINVHLHDNIANIWLWNNVGGGSYLEIFIMRCMGRNCRLKGEARKTLVEKYCFTLIFIRYKSSSIKSLLLYIEPQTKFLILWQNHYLFELI